MIVAAPCRKAVGAPTLLKSLLKWLDPHLFARQTSMVVSYLRAFGALKGIEGIWASKATGVAAHSSVLSLSFWDFTLFQVSCFCNSRTAGHALKVPWCFTEPLVLGFHTCPWTRPL